MAEAQPAISSVHVLGKYLSLLTYASGEEYLIGAQVCTKFHKETFNLYRSLRCRGVYTIRGNESLLAFLIRCRVLSHGTRSVTLVPYHHAVLQLKANPKLISGKQRRPTLEEQRNCEESSSSDCVDETDDADRAVYILANLSRAHI